MSKKTFLIALMLGLLAVIASGTAPVAAQGPLAHGATYLDNQWHWIAPGATQWYAFEYSGDRTNVLLTLTNGVQLNMSFSVYAPDKPSDQPIGRGTSSLVVCSDGNKCQSPDLVWKGGSSSAGTYYIQVVNHANVAQTYLLTTSNGSAMAYPTSPYPASPGSVIIVSPQIVTTPYTPSYVQPYTQPYVQPYYPPGYTTPAYPTYPYYYNNPGYYYPPHYGYPYYR